MSGGLDIVFAGTPAFAVKALKALLASSHRVMAVYTQPDRPAGRGRKLVPGPVKQCALDAGLPVYQPLSLKDPDVQQALDEHGCDVMVVVAYGLILPPAVLAIPRLGCLNIHASLLPRWRGAAPIQRAILAGDAETGVTIMQMDAGLDTGASLLQKRCAILDTDTAASLHDRLAALGAEALLETLEQLAAGTARPEPQPDAGVTYAEKLSKAEALLDWQLPAAQLQRMVRAYNPWPVAHCHWRDKTLRIWEADCRAAAVPGARPGEVIAAGPAGIEVMTGDGVFIIRTLQLPGGRPMSAADFLNAHAMAGERLLPGTGG